jgi:hypothetical protein
MTMIINDFILKNEKLAAQMKIFVEEIARLEQLRDLFKRKSDEEYGPNPNLSLVLNRKLKRAKEQFKMLNDAYDEIAHKGADQNTPAFISEANTEIKEIQLVFTKLRYEKSHTWN